MSYADFLKGLFPDSHNTDGEIYSVLLGAVGSVLDQYDPEHINLAAQFSVTASSGEGLEANGLDWQLMRHSGETDSGFRQRILSLLPMYINGSSIPGIKAVVQTFTGTEPTIFEYGPGAFVMGESAISEAGFCSIGDAFTFEVHVNNPESVSYNHADMENAVKHIKLARSAAIIYHSGTDTSTLNETANAQVTIV